MISSFRFQINRDAALAVATASICALILFGCGGGGNAPTATMSRPAGPASGVVDDSEALRAQDAHAIKVEITVCAPVKRLLPDDTRGLPHEKFLLELSNGTTLLVAHDTAMAPRVPLAVGDRPILHGEYIWNHKGGLIHWTHHTDTPRHEGGWIEFNGKRYE